jgi:hypothetical protein
MQPTKTKPRITEARVGVSVGSQFREEWLKAVPELSVAMDGIKSMRSVTLSVGREVERVADLSPEHRTLRLEALAKKAKAALEALERAEESTANRVHETLSRLGKESSDQLAHVRGDANSAFAAFQVRETVRSLSGGRFGAAMELLEDPEQARAILSAPPAASGLKREQLETLRAGAEQRHLPHIYEARQAAQGALEEVQRSARVARDLIAEATGLEHRTGRGWLAPWEIGD